MSITRPAFPWDSLTRIPNSWVRDPRLKLADKGLLVYILSHAAGYELTMDQMEREAGDGRYAIQSSIKRLCAAGYLTRTRARNGDGTLGTYSYTVTDPAGGDQADPIQDGKISTGSDQGKQGVSAGGDQSGIIHRGKPAVKEEHQGEEQEKVTSPTGSRDSGDPETAQTLLGRWIDYCTSRQVTLPGQVRARYGKEIRLLLEQGFAGELIRRTLGQMLDDGLAGRPSLLAQKIVDMQVRVTPGPRYPTAAERTEQRVSTDLQVTRLMDEAAPHLERAVGRSLTYVERRQLRTRIAEMIRTGVHTCSDPGYSGDKAGLYRQLLISIDAPREVTA